MVLYPRLFLILAAFIRGSLKSFHASISCITDDVSCWCAILSQLVLSASSHKYVSIILTSSIISSNAGFCLLAIMRLSLLRYLYAKARSFFMLIYFSSTKISNHFACSSLISLPVPISSGGIPSEYKLAVNQIARGNLVSPIHLLYPNNPM